MKQTSILQFLKPKPQLAAQTPSQPQRTQSASAEVPTEPAHSPFGTLALGSDSQSPLLTKQPTEKRKRLDEHDESSGAPPPPIVVKQEAKQPSTKVQTTLDFGQTDTSTKRCEHCGMVYSNVASDIAQHKKFCKKQKTKKVSPIALKSDGKMRLSTATSVAGVTFAIIPDLSATSDHPSGRLVKSVLGFDLHLEECVGKAGAKSCMIVALNLQTGGIVSDMDRELLGCIVGEANQRLFVAKRTTGPPVTLCDVHTLFLRRKAIKARATEQVGVSGMSEADKDLFGSLLAPTTTDFFNQSKEKVPSETILSAGGAISEALLDQLARNAEYGVRVAIETQMSFPAGLVPRCATEDSDEHCSLPPSSASSTGACLDERETSTEVVKFETLCLKHVKTINFSRVHEH